MCNFDLVERICNLLILYKVLYLNTIAELIALTIMFQTSFIVVKQIVPIISKAKYNASHTQQYYFKFPSLLKSTVF